MSFFSGIGKIVLAMLVLIGIGVTSCEVNKAYWDRQVRELCELDGGVVVYERVEQSDEENGRNEERFLQVPFEWESSKSPYFMVSREREVLNKYPLVWRDEVDLVQRKDNSIVAQKTSYVRRGGDFPTGFTATSHFSCSEVESINLDLIGSAFPKM